MSDILCRWLNSELQLSKPVEPKTLSADLANGYLIGEVLHKHDLQHDFHRFSRSRTANAKLNNYTRLEPTMQLLGVHFDLGFAQALMQERPGAAARLLYQLYFLLQKKKKACLSGVVMETLQSTATTHLHRIEKDIYSERLRTVVKREADNKLQEISQRYELKGQEVLRRSTVAQYEKELELQKVREDMRIKDIEKLRQAHRKRTEMMARIQKSTVQIPRVPIKHSLKTLDRRHKREQQEARDIQREIDQFERNVKKQLPTGALALSIPFTFSPVKDGGTLHPEQLAQANDEYIQRIRYRLEEEAAARQQRERRRRRMLVLQQQIQEEQEELNRDEQLVACLTRQSQQEKRLAVQLMQVRQQKEFLRQNRIFREKQYQEQRLQEFQEALDRKAALARQTELEHEEETQREMELHRQIAAQRAQARYRKHSDTCREILYQIVDLATKVGEYRLLTDNLIPAKPLREWKELLLLGLPLYDEGASPEPSPKEMEKLEVLNNQDYYEYTTMKGEWAWPEEGEAKQPPPNNNILGHVVHRLKAIVDPPKPETPPPWFPSFTLKAAVLGKAFAGKSSCLAKVAQVHGVHVLSTSKLIQDALDAFLVREACTVQKESACPKGGISPRKSGQQTTNVAEKQTEEASESESGPLSQSPQQEEDKKNDSELSVRAQHGAALDKVLGKGQAVPDELLVNIVLEAIRRVPPDSGWILDGFPMDLEQAQLLEKALSGFDPEKVDQKKRSNKIYLAMDPHAKEEAPPPPSALDVVLLLDLPDDLVLDRAAKQGNVAESRPLPIHTLEEMCALVEENSPVEPPPLKQAPPLDKSLEMAQVQHRIAAFHDTWPKLAWWYSSRQNILVKVNAEEEPEAVFKKVESVIYKAMMQLTDKDVDPTSIVKTAQAPRLTPPLLASDSFTTPQEGLVVQKSLSESSIPTLQGVQANTSAELPIAEVHQCRRLQMSLSTDIVFVDKPLPKEFPEYLVPYWENACASYVTNIKEVMQNLRSERDLIIQYLYNIREEFKHYLSRPDLKQEFVVQWQQDYNSIPEDMRADEDTKAELHQRLSDLSERLWDISERRKEEALQECLVLMGDGWLEDHTALLINHFSTLMQVEVDRIQDTVILLRDYYRGMSGQHLPETQFARIPMVDITEDTQDEDAIGSVQSEQQDMSAGVNDEDKKKTKMIPLMPWIPPSREAVLMKPSSSTELHPNEKLLYDIWQMAVTAVNNLVISGGQQVSQEMPHWEPEESKETQYVAEQGSSQATAPVPNTKDSEKPGNTKGGVPDPPSEEQVASPPPQVEEDVEVVRKRAVRAQIRKEFAAALSHEDIAVKSRLELVYARALSVLRSLHCQVDQAYNAMHEWLHAHFQAEMTSINELVEVAQHHIEAATQIQHELTLDGPNFFINGDMRVVPALTLPLCPPPWELPVNCDFTIRQLTMLHTQFQKVAPAGYMSTKELSEILEDLTSLNMGCDALPELWSQLSVSQIQDMVSLVSQDLEVLDWRRFLLSAALPWPIPSLSQLLEVLGRFQANDPQGTGFVTEELYLQTELWFTEERNTPPPADPLEPLPFDRLAHLKTFFFTLFADHCSAAPRLHYETMLLYFAAHPHCVQGWVRALGVVTGQLIHHRPDSTALLKSIPHMGDVESDYTETESETEAGGTEGKGVSITALLKVVCHGGGRTSSHNRFHPNWKTWQEYEEDFGHLYRELGFGPEEEVPFAMLSQYPLIQDMMENAVQYQLTDIHQFLLAQPVEGESQSFLVS